MLVAGGVLVKGGVEVALQVARGREPLVASLALIRLDAFGLVRPAVARARPLDAGCTAGRVQPVAAPGTVELLVKACKQGEVA